MWSYEQMKPYEGTKVTVKNVDNYLHMFDIEKLDTNIYRVPEYTVTYQEDAEVHGFDIIDLSKLEVEQGDTLVVWAVKHVSPVRSVLEVHSKKSRTTGYIEAYYGSDDARYYLCSSLAEYFKDKDVTVENYLYYNKQHVANHIHSMFNL